MGKLAVAVANVAQRVMKALLDYGLNEENRERANTRIITQYRDLAHIDCEGNWRWHLSGLGT